MSVLDALFQIQRDQDRTLAFRCSCRLGMCGTGDNVDGAMSGSIWGNPLKTILDSGYIEVWAENARTHVALTKTFELSDPAANWLTQRS